MPANPPSTGTPSGTGTPTPPAGTPASPAATSGIDLNVKIIEPGQDWTRPARTVTRTPKKRSDQQLKLDAQAADLHRRWVAAGRPRDMDASPKAEYHVAPEHVDAMTAMLRKTANSGGPVAGKSVKIRQAPHPSGKTAITVAVWDRVED